MLFSNSTFALNLTLLLRELQFYTHSRIIFLQIASKRLQITFKIIYL